MEEEEEDKIQKRSSTFPIFSKHLTLQPITVVDFANECRKQFQQFNQAFRRRITIQLQYAKNLQAVSNSLNKYIQPGTEKAISFICSAFKVQNQQRAHQARELAESLRTQIFEICSNASKQQTTLVKRVQKDVKKYIKEFQSLDEYLQKSYESYQKVNQDTEELIITKNYLKHTSEIPIEKKNKLIAKTMDSIKQKKQYEKNYLSANRNYNEFVLVYNKCITQDMNQVQNQIREQIVLQSDCLRKLIVCQVSMFKNIQYDLINISKQMQALDTQKDVEIIVQNNQNNIDNLMIDSDEYKRMCVSTSTFLDIKEQKRKSVISDISSTMSAQNDSHKHLKTKQSEVGKGMKTVNLRQVEEQVFSCRLTNKKNKDFKQLIEKRWKQLDQSYTQIYNPNRPQQPQQTRQQEMQKQPQQAPKQNKPKPEQTDQPPKQAGDNLRQTFDKYFTNSQLSKQILHYKKQEQKAQTMTEVYDNFLIITRYINEIWNGQCPTLIESKKKNKQQMQSPFLFIKKILSVSHFYRIVSYAYVQSFRIHHKVMIQTPDKAREIAKFVNSLITKSYKQNDVFVLRGLLGLLFTYYWVDGDTKKQMYAQYSIYKNSLWKKHDFWDAAILQSTFEEMLSFGAQKDQSLQETILREKNLIFSQLASYCHYMIMLGINSKDVRQIVGRYCRIYQTNDNQNRDLSKMITNTSKQYKQIVAAHIKDNKDVKSEKETD